MCTLYIHVGVIRVWDLLGGKISHSLEPLPRPHKSDQEREGGGEEGEEEAVPQVYTDLLLSGSRGALVGVTYDHNILFYDSINFKKQKQVYTVGTYKYMQTYIHAHCTQCTYIHVVYTCLVV